MTTNRKALGAINTKGFETNTTNDLNFATGKRHGKAIATQIAELALLGYAVHQLLDGGYLVCKHGYTCHAPCFEALQAVAHRVGVKQ
jgi:hypothetical protein